jgi:hypothetical protein
VAIIAGRAAIAAILIAVGWVAGRAQPQQPDFELVVEAPFGETPVTCRRGCELVWVERGVNPAARRQSTFSFSLRVNESASECEGFYGFLGRKQRGHPPRSVHERSNFLRRSVPSAWGVILWLDRGCHFVQEFLLFVGQTIGTKLPPPRQMFELQLGLIL